MNISNYFKKRFAYIALAWIIILGVATFNSQTVLAEYTTTIKVFSKGNLQRGFGITQIPVEGKQPKLLGELDEVVDALCGRDNQIPVDKGVDCGFAVRHDPVCTAIQDKEQFTDCVRAFTYRFWGGKESSSFFYLGAAPVALGGDSLENNKKYFPLKYTQAKENKNESDYTLIATLVPNQSQDRYNFAYDQTGPAKGSIGYSIGGAISTEVIGLSNRTPSLIGPGFDAGFYKVYWDGCEEIFTKDTNDFLKKTTVCKFSNNTVKVFLDFPEVDYSQATLSLCLNPQRDGNPGQPGYNAKCISDIVQNCFFNSETPFDKCAYEQHPTSITTAITQPQLTQLTTLYCRKFLLTSGDALSPFNNAYLGCLQDSQNECKIDGIGGIQAYGQCVKKIAYEKMAGVDLCLAGKNDEEATTCSLRICKPNDKEVEQCKSAQGITKLESCSERCPTGEVLCKGPALEGADSTAPYLYCYKPTAGQRPAAPAAGTGRAPAAGANPLANCYACKNKVWGTIDPDGDLNSTNPKTMSKETCKKIGGEEAVWATAGTSTKPPASCPTEAATAKKYPCAVCIHNKDTQNNTWFGLKENLTEAECKTEGAKYNNTSRSLKSNDIKDTKANLDDYAKDDYCPLKGPIGKQTTRPQGATVPPKPVAFSCVTKVGSRLTSTSGSAKVDFDKTSEKGFDRVNWYLGRSLDSMEFRGTNENVTGETIFGIPPKSGPALEPNQEYFVQAEFYTEGDNKRDALPCAVGKFVTKSNTTTLKLDSNPTQAVLGTATGSYPVGFYIKAPSNDVTELNVDVKAWGRNGEDRGGSISVEGINNGTARNESVVRVTVNDPSQVDRLVVTTSYTLENRLSRETVTTMYLNRLDDSQPLPESTTQQIVLKPGTGGETVTVWPQNPSSSGVTVVTGNSPTSFSNNWQIQVSKDGLTTKGSPLGDPTHGCENNQGGVCTYQAEFNELLEGRYKAELIIDGSVKTSSEFSVGASLLDQDGKLKLPVGTTGLPTGQTDTAEVIIDLVKLSCSTRNSDTADGGDYVIFQDGSPRTQTITFPEGVTQDTCSLTRYANGNMVDSSVIKFKVGAREEPAAAPGGLPAGDDDAAAGQCHEEMDDLGGGCGQVVDVCPDGSRTPIRKESIGGSCDDGNEAGAPADEPAAPEPPANQGHGNLTYDGAACLNDDNGTYHAYWLRQFEDGYEEKDGPYEVCGCPDGQNLKDGSCQSSNTDSEDGNKEPSCSWHQDDNGNGSYTEYREDCSSETLCFNPGAVTYCNGACSEAGWCVEGDPNSSDAKWYESCACH